MIPKGVYAAGMCYNIKQYFILCNSLICQLSKSTCARDGSYDKLFHRVAVWIEYYQLFPIYICTSKTYELPGNKNVQK